MPLALGVHAAVVRRVAPRSSVPVLRTPSGVVQGSGAILDWAGLPGGDPALERRLADRTGDLVRRFIYAATLSGPENASVRAALAAGVPRWQAGALAVIWPLMRPAMVAGFDSRLADLPRHAAAVEEELAWIEGRLGGRAFLAGDAFGRADITAASMLALLMRPAILSSCAGVRLPESAATALAAWNSQPVLRWVRATYQSHRRRKTS